MNRVVATPGERIYLDSNVLVYFFYSKYKPDLYEKAKDLLRKIENEKFEGIISSLTLMELIKSFRELLIEYGGLRRISDIEDVIFKHVGQLYSINNLRFVEGRPPEFEPMVEIKTLFYYSISNKSLNIFQTYPGKVKMEEGKIIHKGLHAPDAFHLALAKQLQCDKLATFAWEFKETETEVTPLILSDPYAIW